MAVLEQLARAELGPWHLAVAISAAAALLCCAASERLRPQGVAVLLSAAAWLLYWLLGAACIGSDGAGDIGSGIGTAVMIDCCGMMFGTFHALFCLALLVQVIRVLWRSVTERPPGR
jgi:hypothetical protein